MDIKLDNTLGNISSIQKTNSAYILTYATGESAMLNILNNHVFKFYMSPTGEFNDYPIPLHPEDEAKINVKSIDDYGTTAFDNSNIFANNSSYIVETQKINIIFDIESSKMNVIDKITTDVILKERKPLSYTKTQAKQVLQGDDDEFFFGGGMQNGRFSHKEEVIQIKNTNDWVDGGVTSPCPFYWSSKGYGVLRNTWQQGVYDFGSKIVNEIETVHNENYFDCFYFINKNPKDILCDYYELTGNPIFMPEYAFYEAHLNTFNRDYWVKVDPETPGAILFEDSKYYKKYKPKDLRDKPGVLESLNGENDNYQFSARAMIDRYKMHNIPLGWLVPNDGYGSGYGQTDSLDGDVNNLKTFQRFSKENGVEVALWTESHLYPVDPEHPKKGERDLAKEVREAKVVALKCDVAWIGQGYSFGLNAVEIATNIFTKETLHRPMIIMVDGWAGTQRYSGIWSGDQYGGQWEYIRFHIPTYVGAGLSGLPVIGSDMDGIFGGNVKEINIRDFQWKAFTPLQLNMDGWGSKPKTPFSFDYEATTINRAYLKLKSMLMPYNYTVGYESTQGLPMVRAMFLEFPQEVSSYSKDSQYQFMWGPNILVAPVYKVTKSIFDELVRNEIYLPDANQIWTDFLTGEKYQGGKIYNNIKAPLWKIPVFVKTGAILPMIKSNNNPSDIKKNERFFTIYPNGESHFEVYEDDGFSSDYLEGHFAKTKITVTGPKINDEGDLLIHVDKTEGSYNTMINKRNTIFKIKASKCILSIKAALNDQDINIKKVQTFEDFKKNEDVYYFAADHVINKFLLEYGGNELKQGFVLIKLKEYDVTTHQVHIKIKGYDDKSKVFGNITNINNSIHIPSSFTVLEDKTTSSSLTLQWKKTDSTYYEIERDGTIFSNILGNSFTFENFKPSTKHSFKIRAVKDTGMSKWSYTIIAETGEDPVKHIVKGVKVSCNIRCEPCHEVENLTNDEIHTIWHTDWNQPGMANPKKRSVIKLNFDLQDVYAIDKIEYLPRVDSGNGTIIEIKYRTSFNEQEWSPFSQVFQWNCDSNGKIIKLNGSKFRYIEIHVLDSCGGFGSGRALRFHKVV